MKLFELIKSLIATDREVRELLEKRKRLIDGTEPKKRIRIVRIKKKPETLVAFFFRLIFNSINN